MNGRLVKLIGTAGLILAAIIIAILGLFFGDTSSSSAASKGAGDTKVSTPTPAAEKTQSSAPASLSTVTPLYEGFETGLGAFTSFSIGCATTHCLWGSTTTDYHTGTHAGYAADVAEVGDDYLPLTYSLAIPTNATSASLTFWHKYGFEYNGTNYYDGGVLEVSTDGGTTWADAGANITANGYNGTIATGHSNPLAGHVGWVANTAGAYEQVQVNLMPYRGPSFSLRLRLGTDDSNSSTGWFVDDVQVSFEAPLASCTTLWSTAANYPSLISLPAVTTLGSLLYSFGGKVTAATASSYTYDPGSDAWTAIAPIPLARLGASAVTDGTSIYVLGGADANDEPTNTLWRYDPSSNSYTTLSPFTTATLAQAAVYLDGKIYRIAGETDPTQGTSTTTVEVYTIATNSWASAAPIPQGVFGLSVIALNGYIYAAGGEQYLGPTSKTYRYDPASDAWDDGPIADLPGPGGYMASAFYNGRWVLSSAGAGPNANAIAWDPAANTWSSIEQQVQSVTQAGAGVVDGAFYVIGGYKYPGGVNSVQKYVERNCACSLEFSDVPQGSTFYPYVHCLVCLGIISGYSDGTFRPNSNVSRGQISKIVSNAAGLNEVQTTQLFEDVTPGSTFFDFVGRLASADYIGGYPCGGVGEPCGSGNLPYFRPNANASRGQISKIVSNTAGFSDPQTTQMFEDVPTGSTFFDFVGRLASRGFIGGYPCGGAGEPCGSGNLPYFRPTANATRGQSSKIVANTFLPECTAP